MNIFPYISTNWLNHHLHRIFIIYMRYCLQLVSPINSLRCLHMLSFSQCEYFSTITEKIVYSTIFTVRLHCYIRYCLQLLSPVYLFCRLHMLSFWQCEYFSQLLYNFLFRYVYSETSLDTCSTVHNYTTQYTDFAVYICYPFHNVIFFHNHCPIDSTTMSIAYP